MLYNWLLLGYILVWAQLLDTAPRSQVSVSSSAAASVKYPPPGQGGSPQAYISSLSSAKADPKIPVTVNDGAAEEKPKTEWDYEPSDTAYGPANWHKLSPRCAGPNQSPIDIVTDSTTVKPFDSPLAFQMEAGTPIQGKLVNTGKTVGFNVQGGSPVLLSGAILGEDTYIFKQFHLHFGCAGGQGSEHSIDGKKYAGEIHLVFVNQKYQNPKVAMQQKDGLAILAFFLQLNPAAPPNPEFQKVAVNVGNIAKPKQEINIPSGINIRQMLPMLQEGLSNLRRYVYRGSIPTPPCFESVTWIVFKRPIQIGPDKVANIKKAKGKHFLSICGNTRPIQPLNGRVIHEFSPAPTTQRPSATQRRSTTMMMPTPPGFSRLPFTGSRPSLPSGASRPAILTVPTGFTRPGGFSGSRRPTAPTISTRARSNNVMLT